MQTADYARALFEAWRQAEDQLDQMVSVRMDRQSIFDLPDPPSLWVIVDEGVLRRCIGSSKITHDQLAHLAAMADRSMVTVQVVPAEAGAHVGLQGAFAIASVDGVDTVYLEGPSQGHTTQRARWPCVTPRTAADPQLAFSDRAWAQFVQGVKQGEFDLA